MAEVSTYPQDSLYQAHLKEIDKKLQRIEKHINAQLETEDTCSFLMTSRNEGEPSIFDLSSRYSTFSARRSRESKPKETTKKNLQTIKQYRESWRTFNTRGVGSNDPKQSRGDAVCGRLLVVSDTKPGCELMVLLITRIEDPT